GSIDGNGGNSPAIQGQDQTEWQHAWVLTNHPLVPKIQNTYCYQAVETDPADANAAAYDGYETIATYHCRAYSAVYDDLRQLFTGIQVAGPRLSPSSISQGFHAIPPRPSTDAQVPACFYNTGDFTCVKDAIVEWWDPTANDPNGTPGAWRAPHQGARVIGDAWPAVDINQAKDPTIDPINGFEGTYFFCC
ncbi:MAG: hypothetical protein ACYDGR_04385, partial [Candidatus Dormibacteria bacterium]